MKSAISYAVSKYKAVRSYGIFYKILAKAYTKCLELALGLNFRFHTYRFYFLYQSTLRRAIIGKNVKVFQKVDIRGPGKIVVGSGVRFGYPMSPFFRKHHIEIITKFPSSELIVGDECTIGNNNKFIVVGRILLGKKCKTGHNNEFYDSDLHSIDKDLRHNGGDLDGFRGDVILNDNVMVGSNVLIGPDTLVGENCVIGMGSVLKRRKYERDMIVVGNPARPVCKISIQKPSLVSKNG